MATKLEAIEGFMNLGLSRADASMIVDIINHAMSESEKAILRVTESGPPHLSSVISLGILVALNKQGDMAKETIAELRERMGHG